MRKLWIAKRILAAGMCISAPVAANAATFDSNSVVFEDITGSVEITTTTGDEIDVEIRQGKEYSKIEVQEVNGVVVLSGDRWKEDGTRNCCDQRIWREESLRKDRKLTTSPETEDGVFAEYPTIIVSMPYQGNVKFVDARIKLHLDNLKGRLDLDACFVHGETGDLEEAVIGVINGSRLVTGDIAAGLEIDVSGDADVMTGDAHIVDVDIAGPGDVVLGDIKGMLDVQIAGSGIVRATRLEGPAQVRIAGSGGVAVKSGIVDKLRATIDGSGGVYFGGQAKQPALHLYGSAEVRMRSVNGRIVKHGSGTVYVGDKVFSDE